MQSCPENESLLQDLTPTEPETWSQHRSVAVYIIYAESDGPLAIEAATDVKQWLHMRSGLSESAVLLQGSSNDDQTLACDQADIVVVIQTKHVLREAFALTNLYTAVRKHVPIGEKTARNLALNFLRLGSNTRQTLDPGPWTRVGIENRDSVLLLLLLFSQFRSS